MVLSDVVSVSVTVLVSFIFVLILASFIACKRKCGKQCLKTIHRPAGEDHGKAIDGSESVDCTGKITDGVNGCPKGKTGSLSVREVSDFFRCECSIINRSEKGGLLSAYMAARKAGIKEGFIPIVISESYFRHLVEDLYSLSREELTEMRKSAMARFALIDSNVVIGEFLAGHEADEYVADGMYDGCDCGYEEVPDLMQADDYSKEFILLHLPVSKPEDIFAWIPFGGFNECPDIDDQAAFAKCWNEKFGAYPAAITEDTLEYVVDKLPTEEESRQLALQQYAFSPDIVEQGISLSCLTEYLRKNKVWFFWWD